ncbi:MULTISPECIES: PspA/IM30 family protein [Paenibacillus]|jgi:phage shock protein A|uniref:Phage shock protein A n=2 Tax=Paenibacillus TaxID=44249 RepID=A0A1R1ECV0_9BACL|nr:MULTISPECIES: PspA/IM30 family protein [Paenibacillus]MBJ9991397.1 PspA/IM30 family protein [Paenibacillus sp. S28]MEC0175204.1 PspA/IM30 family protein [Paenibacillus favisporus]OMF49645.1 phage shock protein A [Paenibacillus rhizosphaerae]OXL87279.1 phage shock protein A [Paenibacillus sp. SSG-1]PQP90728.1 phage shock protein A [Paenibacillus sp. AR247]
MSVFRRVRDITVATLNERLEQSQDPVRLIDQFLASTRDDIMEAEKLVQQYSAHVRQLKQQVDQASNMKEKREEQALLALKAGEDHLAKLALQEKIIYEEKLEQYGGLLDTTRQSLTELENQLNDLKLEYQTVYSKRQYYAARMETLRLQQRMNQRMEGFGGQDVPKMFNRLEDRISDWEFEARSLRDLRRGGQELFEQASGTVSSVLERELARLKEKLNNSGKE